MKSPEAWRVELMPPAEKALARLPPLAQADIVDALHDLEDDPEPPDSIAMRGKGQGLRRIRVEQFRVIYRVQPQRRTILVLRVGERREVYRGFEKRRRRKRGAT